MEDDHVTQGMNGYLNGYGGHVNGTANANQPKPKRRPPPATKEPWRPPLAATPEELLSWLKPVTKRFRGAISQFARVEIERETAGRRLSEMAKLPYYQTINVRYSDPIFQAAEKEHRIARECGAATFQQIGNVVHELSDQSSHFRWELEKSKAEPLVRELAQEVMGASSPLFNEEDHGPTGADADRLVGSAMRLLMVLEDEVERLNKIIRRMRARH